jgi:hypothetical protein
MEEKKEGRKREEKGKKKEDT